MEEIKTKLGFLTIIDTPKIKKHSIVAISDGSEDLVEYEKLSFGKWELLEVDEHLCCQNWPNCEEEGCGGGK